jgi:nucleoside phosphorylase
MMRNRVLILTALNLEYAEVLRRLTRLERDDHPQGTLFEVGTIGDTQCQVVLGLTGKGNGAAGVIAAQAIEKFSPSAVLFVGVAGALWDSMELGDVIVATHVYGYHGATASDDGLQARPRVWEISHRISQLAARLGRTGDWAIPGEPASPVRFGPIASGELVLNQHRSGDQRDWLLDHYNDALAIEMESAGVAQACQVTNTPLGVIRGISDMADGTKSYGSDRIRQPQAADNAAAFAVHLAKELITELAKRPMIDGPGGHDRRSADGLLRLSWVEDGRKELILETAELNVSIGRNKYNRVHLPDHRDGRYQGHLAKVGDELTYQHLGRHPVYLTGARRQLTIAEGESCPVRDKDRLRFASGTMLIEYSAPDEIDSQAGLTSNVGEV